MQFSSYRRGALLTALQLFAIGLALCAIIWFLNIYLSLIILALWVLACLWLFLRLCCVKVFTLHGILHVEKGRLFPHAIRLPICHITGVHIVQTPLALACSSCWCFVHTSGFTFMLLGIRHNDALQLSALIKSEEI